MYSTDLLSKGKRYFHCKARVNHSKTSLKTTFRNSLFFFPSVMMANFKASGFPTLEQATYSCP